MIDDASRRCARVADTNSTPGQRAAGESSLPPALFGVKIDMSTPQAPPHVHPAGCFESSRVLFPAPSPNPPPFVCFGYGSACESLKIVSRLTKDWRHGRVVGKQGSSWCSDQHVLQMVQYCPFSVPRRRWSCWGLEQLPPVGLRDVGAGSVICSLV